MHCLHWYASKRSTINDQINRPISFCALYHKCMASGSWLCICFVEWLTNQSCPLALEDGDCSQYVVHELNTVNGRFYMTFKITFKRLWSIRFFLSSTFIDRVKIYLLKRNRLTDKFCTLFSESVSVIFKT